MNLQLLTFELFADTFFMIEPKLQTDRQTMTSTFIKLYQHSTVMIRDKTRKARRSTVESLTAETDRLSVVEVRSVGRDGMSEVHVIGKNGLKPRLHCDTGVYSRRFRDCSRHCGGDVNETGTFETQTETIIKRRLETETALETLTSLHCGQGIRYMEQPSRHRDK